MARSILAAVQQIKADVAHFLSPQLIRDVCAAVGHVWRQRLLDPVTTVHLFVLQMLHGNTACSHVPRLGAVACSGEAYCQARQRLPLRLLQDLLRALSQHLGASALLDEGRWHGHRTFLMDGSSASEPAWQRLRAGIGLFTASGRLNTRAQAEAVVAELLPQLQDGAWAKTRRYLQQPQLLTYLDRVAQRLAAWSVPARQAAVRALELERQAEQRRSGANAALVAGLLLVVGLLRSLAEGLARGVVAAVTALLAQAWRGSSAVGRDE